MRSLASPTLPLYLSIGALAAGLGIQVFAPLSVPERPIPHIASVGAERLAAMQERLTQDITTLLDKAPALMPRTESVILRRGDTLSDVLERAGLTRTRAASLVQAVQGIHNPKKMHVGQAVELTFDPLSPTADSMPARMAFEVAPGQRVTVERQLDGAYQAKTIIAPTHVETTRAVGTINSTLYAAAEEQHLPAEQLAAFVKMFSYDVDFQRDLQKGDRFEIMYDHEMTQDGQLVRNGTIRYASLTVGGTPLKLYAFRSEDGEIDYYNDKGEGVRKALLRTPVNGATLTSAFGMRKHPILGYSIMHRGSDFGAPVGTPIMAAGDGTVEKRELSPTYGNYIRIRHGNGFSTAYAHMSRFGANIANGKRVRQGDIIGYVGATGRVTGPHLHFEVLRDGQQVNPVTVKFPSSMKLEGNILARFRSQQLTSDQMFVKLGEKPVAETPAETTHANAE